VFEKGDTVVYTWTGVGTHDGPLATPAGQVPPTGRRGRIEGVLISTVKNGKIVREETYWNQIDLLAQLGLM
jgi:predicted ester cyclase